MFDKTDPEHYQNMGAFSKRFKAVPDCKLQHLRQLYGAIKKWKYIEPKMVEAAESKEEEKWDGDESAGGQSAVTQTPDIYEIGKRFYFWDSLRKHADFVAAKYQNMKEELLNSPLLAGSLSMRSWTNLTELIEVLISTEIAHEITSNGHSEYLYGIRKSEPFDAQHLRALKLYTDFTDLSATFCGIVRRGDRAEMAEIGHWTRNLIETVQCFGSPLTAKKTYFRGVNRTFIFKMIVTRFNLPLSTTTDVK